MQGKGSGAPEKRTGAQADQAFQARSAEGGRPGVAGEEGDLAVRGEPAEQAIREPRAQADFRIVEFAEPAHGGLQAHVAAPVLGRGGRRREEEPDEEEEDHRASEHPAF
jgi:hypothetical protein